MVLKEPQPLCLPAMRMAPNRKYHKKKNEILKRIDNRIQNNWKSHERINDKHRNDLIPHVMHVNTSQNDWRSHIFHLGILIILIEANSL